MSTFLSGDEIRERREGLGLTQKQVVEHLGLVDPTNVSDWENDKISVPEKHHKPLLALLEVVSNKDTLENLDPESEYRREFGVGKNQVYLFYDPRDKQEAESMLKNVWACNIGSTTRPVEERVGEQTDQWTVAPVIALIFRCAHENECRELESRIQNILKIFGRQRGDLKGREWFDTSPDEVVVVYKFINQMKRPESSLKPEKPLKTAKLPKPEKYRSYFQSLVDILREKHAFTNARVGQPQNWYNFASGITGVNYGAQFIRDGRTLVWVGIFQTQFKHDRIAFFDVLAQHREEITAQFNLPLSWHRDEEKKTSYIAVYRDGDIEASESELEDIRDWHVEYLLKFKAVFQPELKKVLRILTDE